MRRYVLVCVVVLAAAVVASAGDHKVKVPCQEYERVTGQKICDMNPVITMDRSYWEGKKRAANRDNEGVIELWNGEGEEGSGPMPQDNCVLDASGTKKVCTRSDGTRVVRSAVELWD